ncbi:MAG: 2-dehydro-3-deoxygalactonokinase [Novosphingobium sp.]|nr:2-dehydro-3-deoxygalactonokinase [Novosphingobium sp.]
MTTRVLGDWGTTHLRLWLEREGTIVERLDGPGIGAIAAAPAMVLAEELEPWWKHGGVDAIVLCGMAGARNGLIEAPYVDCPAGRGEWGAGALRRTFDGAALIIGAGLATPLAGSPPDVMRGEEAQVFGALELVPALREGRHVALHPGTHSKWIWLEDGRITGFRTVVTGELFALLCRSSLLAAGGEPGKADEDAGFAAGLARAGGGSGVLAQLFETRAAQLRLGRSAGWATGFLSGLLIGHEVAEIAAAQALPPQLWLIGDPHLCDRYERALAAHGIAAVQLDGEECVLAGLRSLHANA